MVDQGDNQQKHQENANNYSSDMDSIYPSLFPTTNDLDKTKTKNSNSNNNNRDNDCDSFYPTPPFQVSNTPMIMATQPNQSHYPMLPDMECTSGSSPPASASKLSSRPFSYSSRALSGVSATSTRTGVSSLSVLSQCPHDNNSNTADNSNNINTNDAVTCSFYESLRQEAASCCPLCGFQILANPNASTSANTHATTAHHLPVGTCFVCLQAVVEGAVKGNNVSYNNSLNNSTKVNNTNWMTKERQVQEDRQLAASLSVMILEEEPKQEENNQDHHHHRGRQAVALLEDYGDDLIVASGNDNGNDIDNGNDYSRSNFTPNGNIDSQSPHCYSYPSEETIAEFTTSPLCSSRHHNHVQHRNETHMTPREWLVKEQMAMLAAAAADAAYSRNDTTAKKNENALYAENTEVANTTDSNSNSIKNCHTNSSGNSNNTLITPSHDRKCTDSCGVVYIGNYNILDQPHGSHGELIWDNGDRYVGTVQNGMRSGQGTFFFRDGSEYTGDWEDNQMHGCGQRKFANGDTYIGQYHKGQRSGGPKCKLRFANGDLYVGGWENDRFHGDGRYFFAHDGSVLEGSFVHGAKEGKFKLQRQLPNEKLDILRFESDKLIGLGVRWNAKRSKTWLLQVVPVPNQGPAVRKHNNSNINSNNKERQETATTISCKDDNNEHDSNNSSTTSAEKKTKKKKFHHRVVGYLVKPLRRDFRCRTKLSVEPVALMPSSSSSSSSVVIPVDSSSKINGDNDDSATTNARSSSSFSASMSPSPSISPFFSLPVDNIVPVVPEKILTNIKKSVRIPISQAVSIGYDCEMGTTTITAKTTRISTKVMSTASPSVSPTGQRFQTVVS